MLLDGWDTHTHTHTHTLTRTHHSRFTKNLKPSDLSLKFLIGNGSLNNLELNAQFLTEILQLPPWIQISRAVCDSIKAHVPFMKLGTEPIKFMSPSFSKYRYIFYQ